MSTNYKYYFDDLEAIDQAASSEVSSSILVKRFQIKLVFEDSGERENILSIQNSQSQEI